jgi:surface antigen
MSLKLQVVCLAVAILVAACGSTHTGTTAGLSNATGGTVLGAAGGALLGSQVGKGKGKWVGAAVGAVAGGLTGSVIGQRLDQRDRLLADKAERDALENGRTGQPVSWRNPDNGRNGRIVPEAPYKQGNGYCRQYSHQVTIDGRSESLRGTSCRNADGSWRNVA